MYVLYYKIIHDKQIISLHRIANSMLYVWLLKNKKRKDNVIY